MSSESERFPNSHLVLIVGGGALVEAVRDVDRRSPLGTVAAHWICIQLLDVTARLVAEVLPELPLLEDMDALRGRISSPGISLFAPAQYLRRAEPTCAGTRLPCGWEVTSDSIAARLAVTLPADELVLLKPVRPPRPATDANLPYLARVGYVDPFLPELLSELPAIRCCQLG